MHDGVRGVPGSRATAPQEAPAADPTQEPTGCATHEPASRPTPEPATGAPTRAPQPPGTTRELDDLLLGGPRTLTAADLARRYDIEIDLVRTFWRTLGLPAGGDDEPLYTERDAEAIRLAGSLLRTYGLALPTVVTVVRAFGHTSDRLALWQVEALVEDMASRYALDDTSARLLVLDRLKDLAPVLEQQLLHSYRRQLAAVADRYATEFGEVREDSGEVGRLPLARAVGFADMVSFTRRTAGLGSTDLSQFVQRFEAAARDVVVGAGGRVVKTIGDAVLFIADTPGVGARVALGLADAFGASLDVDAERGAGGLAEGARGVTPVRVGMVWGRVLSRFGDVFGPVVNLAARLTDVAEPSTVLVDAGTAAVLGGDPRFVLERLPARDLAGVGEVTPYRLSTAGA
ncbi:adenylate/guanylate cyclase domain-containing protein [Cellulomonas shaoxiangyii]|uniref:Adenylate/guanylate cyclase domain-containing protein n=1 Tax=Cellulomonas shaoxiangyii TaxID=2566013 RepID=A0A4P7SJ73_9CELL|nr:adenylate/guanylate cyclase domain-containing protein [Cellulomonas shaoxiangyii]QCB94309.1 adenylate/guanylate cyclase domain-containing protein [Cellulomonas shaoxiangyii]TGY84532.1 adenylate/guanylate cyclase domain-containing protein [Cellulomonas shaoxiangyii]